MLANGFISSYVIKIVITWLLNFSSSFKVGKSCFLGHWITQVYQENTCKMTPNMISRMIYDSKNEFKYNSEKCFSEMVSTMILKSISTIISNITSNRDLKNEFKHNFKKYFKHAFKTKSEFTQWFQKGIQIDFKHDVNNAFKHLFQKWFQYLL